jgi:AcrR family transcriptional regulator|tara:strand:+ start:2298 stop:2915 length:618 start_codon:yes stop_codon:yes gene_type:complete
MIDFKPKKLPKQARSRASFDAMIEATAQLLASAPYGELTTNHIAERAGVSIGTLYEFFPNKEVIVAVLAARRMEKLVENLQAALPATIGMSPFEGVAHILDAAVSGMVAERALYHALLRQIPFVPQLPEVRAARAAQINFAQMIRVRAGTTLNLPAPEDDAWLISQMLNNAILEIVFLDVGEKARSKLVTELARLTYRMAVGRDP